MKTTKKIFFVLIISFIFFQLTVYSQERSVSDQDSSELEKDVSSENNSQLDLAKSSIVVLSFAGDTIDKAAIGEKLKVHFKNGTEFDELWVYANNIRIDNLKQLKDESNWYWFEFKKVVDQNDTLSKILNPNNKPEISVRLSVGTNRDNRKTIADNFTIVFDKNKKSRGRWSGTTILVIFIITIILFIRKKCNILRDQGTQLENPPFSLSRTQMAFWTFTILIAYFIVWWNIGETIDISGQVLALLGISAGTTIGGHLMDGDDISNPKIIKRHQEENNSKSFLLNILSDSNGLSIHRFQNVVFSIAIASYFLYEVWHNYKIPELNDNLMIIMGISSGTYLAIKKGENKAFQETSVG